MQSRFAYLLDVYFIQLLTGCVLCVFSSGKYKLKWLIFS